MEEEILSQLDKLKTKNAYISLNDEVFEEVLTIDQASYLCNGAKFINCFFEQNTIFKNINLGIGAIFENCTFKKNLSFVDVTASGYSVEFSDKSLSIKLSNCKIDGSLYFEKCKIDRNIEIENKSELNEIRIYETYVKNEGIKTFDSTIKGLFDVNNLETKHGLRLEKTKFEESLRIQNLFGDGISFLKSEFKKDIRLWSGDIKSLTFNDGIFDEELNISVVKCSGYLTIVGGKFNKAFNIDLKDSDRKGSIANVYLKNCSFEESFNLNGFIDKTGKPEIEYVKIIASRLLKGCLHLNFINARKVLISGNNENAEIKLTTINVKDFEVFSFNNYGNFRVSSFAAMDKDSEIKILDSNLGKAQFYNTQFDQFKSVRMSDVIISEVLTSNVKWFDSSKLPIFIPQDKAVIDEFMKDTDSERKRVAKEVVLKRLRGRRDLFRQLKYAMDKQGDRVQALKFQALEMGAHYKELQHTSSLWNIDRLILLFSKSNDFGQNWWKPIWLAGLINLFFYLLIITSQSSAFMFYPSFTWIDIKLTLNFWIDTFGKYWQLLNPAHILDRMYPERTTINGWTQFWDFLSRLILSFFIFQAVTAFRKFVK